MNESRIFMVALCVVSMCALGGCVEEPPDAVGCYVGNSTSSIKFYVDGELVSEENDSTSGDDLDFVESFSEDFRVDAGDDCYLDANFDDSASFSFIPLSCPLAAGELGTFDMFYTGQGEFREDDQMFVRYEIRGDKVVNGRKVEISGWVEFLGEKLQKCY